MPTVASLWSSDIKPNVLSPFAILDPQAQALTEQTKGLLVGELKVAHDNEKKTTSLTLDLIAPVLNNYRRRILTATYRTDMLYPVMVDADSFRRTARRIPEPAGFNPFASPKKAANEASSDEEFQRLVEQVLQSPEVTAVAVSLIAQINDVQQKKQDLATKQPQAADSAVSGELASPEDQSSNHSEPSD